MKNLLAIGLLIAGLHNVGAFAAELETQGDETAAVRTTGEAYVKAFNAHDATALAGFWSPDAVYTNRLTRQQVVGQEAIASQFKAIFEQANDLKLEVEVDSIDFVSPNVAIERGMARFLTPAGEPDEVDYSAVYVRRDGKWLLDRVTDDPKPILQSHYHHLKELEWMIGGWVDDDENVRIATDCNWTKNKNFITRTFSVSVADRIELSGIQFIGWDAKAKQIRSWTFDSDGGFAEGKWSRGDNRWYVRKKGTTADGQTTTAVNIIKYVDNDAFKLQSTQRTLAGELLPNVDEVLVVRR